MFLLLSGIGRYIAKELSNGGAHTIALSRTQADLDSLKAEVGYPRRCVGNISGLWLRSMLTNMELSHRV